MSGGGYKNYGVGGSGSGGGGSSVGYQSTGGGDASSDFSRISHTIGNNIQKISQNISSMQRMVNQLGTPQDSDQLRSQLHQLQHYTNQLAKDTNAHLKEISALPSSLNDSDRKQKRMLRDRLTNDFSEVLKNFQVIQRTAAQKEKESVIRARAASRHSDEDGSSGTLIDLHGSSAAMKSSGQLQQQTQIQMEEEVDLEELREREKSIRKIESDIVDVNQIFKDLATMIHAQGEVIDSIESNVESATIQVQEGATQIAKARDYQAAKRRKTCILAVFLASILFFIIFMIWLAK